MDFLASFWSFFWFMVSAFVFVAYLIALFSIITDLFRDRELKGWAKAIWLVALVFIPFITSLVYLVARGEGMARRNVKEVRESTAAAEEYIRSVAQASPSDEIAKAKGLLDAGVISLEEYEQIKRHALTTVSGAA